MTQRQINDFFQRSNTNTPNTRINDTTSERSPTQNTNSSTLSTTVEDAPLPQAIIKTINMLCNKYAAIYCSSLNINQTIDTLKRHKTEGTVPPQFEFKFKKLFTKETETNLRSTVINATIDQELSRLQSKLMELDTTYGNRLHDLDQIITNPLNLCDFRVNPTQLVETFTSTLQNTKLTFILKQNKDKQIKEAKREQFLARKELDNEIATLSTKQVNKLNKEIKELKDSLKKAKINSNSNPRKSGNNKRSKNAKGGQVKSTGQKKKNNGKKKSTSKNK